MSRFFALAFAVASALAGCSSPCMQIQQALCECKGLTQNERNSCEDAASAQEKLAPPTDAELTQCESLLSGCQDFITTNGCDQLQTRAGRQACGIAEPGN